MARGAMREADSKVGIDLMVVRDLYAVPKCAICLDAPHLAKSPAYSPNASHSLVSSFSI